MKQRKGDLLPAIGFLAPNFIGFLIFCAGPLLYSLAVSFSDWNVARPGVFHWVGFGNFTDLLSDASFHTYFVNTVYLMIGIPVSIFGSLMLAILLSQKLKGMVVYRTLFYLPSFTSGVALMILWKALFNPDFGPIDYALNNFFHFLHVDAQAPAWLLSTKNIFALDIEKLGFNPKQFGLGARDALIIMGVWTGIGGNNMLLYLAALTNVPQELYEAADLDGASKWDAFRHVTWPQLAPTTFFIVVMSVIGGFQAGFDQARVMTAGGPAGTTTTMSYYIYQKAFEEFQMGYASAVSWLLFIIIFVMTVINWRLGNREDD
ncbi:MAG: sugar ABC transporter permease [Capsulimonadaceae bacterium]|nr:sugar ABC transporter permease [Capsulimonadaceae bacterium]